MNEHYQFLQFSYSEIVSPSILSKYDIIIVYLFINLFILLICTLEFLFMNMISLNTLIVEYFYCFRLLFDRNIDYLYNLHCLNFHIVYLKSTMYQHANIDHSMITKPPN